LRAIKPDQPCGSPGTCALLAQAAQRLHQARQTPAESLSGCGARSSGPRPLGGGLPEPIPAGRRSSLASSRARGRQEPTPGGLADRTPTNWAGHQCRSTERGPAERRLAGTRLFVEPQVPQGSGERTQWRDPMSRNAGHRTTCRASLTHKPTRTFRRRRRGLGQSTMTRDHQTSMRNQFAVRTKDCDADHERTTLRVMSKNAAAQIRTSILQRQASQPPRSTSVWASSNKQRRHRH
jgi:hypothetical protein